MRTISLLMVLIAFQAPNAIAQQVQPQFLEVVTNGVTKIVAPDGRYVIVDSETGWAEMEENGDVVRVQVPSPQKRLRASHANSPEQYIKLRNRFAERIIGRSRQISSTNVYDAVRIASLLTSDRASDHLQLTDAEREKIQALISEFHGRLKNFHIDDQTTQAEADWLRLNQRAIVGQYADEIRDVLGDERMTKISKWSPASIGVVKAITETPMGEALELTDRQKVIERLKEELEESRNQVMESLDEILDEDQKERLGKHLGDLLKQQIYGTSTDKFIESFDYKLENEETSDDRK